MPIRACQTSHTYIDLITKGITMKQLSRPVTPIISAWCTHPLLVIQNRHSKMISPSKKGTVVLSQMIDEQNRFWYSLRVAVVHNFSGHLQDVARIHLVTYA